MCVMKSFSADRTVENNSTWLQPAGFFQLKKERYIKDGHTVDSIYCLFTHLFTKANRSYIFRSRTLNCFLLKIDSCHIDRTYIYILEIEISVVFLVWFAKMNVSKGICSGIF
jgi:hypothetical protein